jgi:creatinine amidohydrolase
MAFKRFWAELKSSEFAALDPNSTLAILPVAATEQHGPHLPVMTDTAIAEGMTVPCSRDSPTSSGIVPAHADDRKIQRASALARLITYSADNRLVSGARSARVCIAPACASWSSSIRMATTTM